MRSIRKVIAIVMLIWTPLFFCAAAYASTQMDLAREASFASVEAPHSCHDMHEKIGDSHQDMKHETSESYCQQCGFCVSLATPLNDVKTNIISPMPALALKAMWVSSTQNIIPDQRPPIDA